MLDNSRFFVSYRLFKRGKGEMIKLDREDIYLEIRRKSIMEKLALRVEMNFCEECSLALRRFIGNMEGVESIDVEDGRIVITFDNSKVPAEALFMIAKDNIEKLGYKLEGLDFV